jgi:U3 small nucleolar ribonucleoprotein protein IMP4
MIRKNIRLRKEYLIRMEDEKKNKVKYDKKMSMKLA